MTMILYNKGRVNDSTIMPFGKHKGKRLDEVPADYLLWLADQPEVKYKYPTIFVYIDSRRPWLEMEARVQQAE
jgi:hypothetical protein